MDAEQVEGYLDQEDYAEQQDTNEDNAWEQAQVPTQKRNESLFGLFQKVWKAEDSSKVANLDKYELGRLDFSVRDSQYLALLGTLLHHDKFATFFKSSGEILCKTSASKKGWFAELFISQKKFTQRAAAVSGVAGQAQQKQKWSLFQGQSNTSGEGQQTQ